MYKVKLDGKYLYHPWDGKLTLADGTLTQELNKNGVFDFSIPLAHPLAGGILRRKSVVEVIRFHKNRAEETVYRGCCMNDTVNTGLELKVETDGDLVFLQDSVIRPYGLSHDVKRTPAEQFAWLVGQHNAQMEDFKRFTVGTVNVPGAEEERRETAYSTTREAVDRLVEECGGYVRTRTVGGTHYIDYISGYGSQPGQEVRQGKNVIDVTKYVKTDEMATRVIPVGSVTNNEPPLTVKSVNGGLDYIQDEEAVADFGIITKVVEFSDISEPSRLLQAGKDYLEGAKGAGLTVELGAVDLADAGYDAEAIRVGDMVPCTAPAYGINLQMQVSKRTTDLLHPDRSRITLGASLQTLTRKQLSDSAGILPLVRRAVSVAGSASDQADEAAVGVRDLREQVENIQTGMPSYGSITNLEIDNICG